MKNYIKILFLILLCTQWSCKKDPEVDASGVTIRLKSLWSISVTDDGQQAYNYVAQSIVYNGNILIGAEKKDKISFKMMEASTGKLLWEWNDLVPNSINQSIQYAYVKDNLLFWQMRNWNYCIDLKTGATVWKNAFEYDYDLSAIGFGDYYYAGTYRGINGVIEGGGWAVRFDTKNGLPENIVRPRYDITKADPKYSVTGNATAVNPFVYQNDTLLIVSFADPPTTNPLRFPSFLGLYNQSKSKWIYERIPIVEPKIEGVDRTPAINNGKIYNITFRSVTCHDILTGEKLWQRNFNNGFLFNALMIQGNRLYVKNEERTLRCLDLDSGAIIWEEEVSGTCSEMAYLNGVIYMVGGGDGLLHAVDAKTGKHYWRIRSPEKDKNDLASFFRYVGVVEGKNGQKGYVIVTTGFNAHCYEAVK